MPTPQPGILSPGNAHAYFLVLRVRPSPQASIAAARALGEAQPIATGTAALDPGARLVLSAGIGPGMWERISPSSRPKGLRPFKPLGAGERAAPATGGDLFFHVASARHDLNFELVSRLKSTLGSEVEVLEEVHGFRYLDSRDLTGFIDGTENPAGEERAEVALIGGEDPEFAAGSYVATQRYVHDLEGWRRLPDADQEGVIGRTKGDSVELADGVKPATAHISRVVIEEGGEELQILRQSYPYGSAREAGLFFVAYGRTIDNFEKMLARMMGASGDGVHDRLMEFSRAVSGATFFVPSMEALAGLGS
jgi:porphyrinogen peroxidase